MPEKPRTTKQQRIKFAVFTLLILIMIGITIWLMPWFISLTEEETRKAFVESIRAKGAWGVLVLLGIQLLQVVVAIIPGEAVELIAGILYGPWGGYLICTVGTILSSMIVFLVVRKLGAGFVRSVISEEKMKKLSFLYDTKKLDTIVFVLFFIPGTPKDLLTYFVPLTDMKLSRFLVLSSLARIPSILSSTYLGSSLYNGKIGLSIFLFLVTGTFGILGILFNDRITNKLRKK